MSRHREQDPYTGVLPVYKEKGWTSNDVVVKLRGILSMKRIGHTGTLDPEAEGVLPVCLGKATRIAGYLTDTDKTYRCVMRLGITTDTEDMTGNILKTRDIKDLEENSVISALQGFVGEYDQIPPMYSAKKINGKKLYEIAREGIEIERKPSRVFIRSISDISVNFTGDEGRASFTVECSKGTYIRSLCRDVGEALGCGGSMESLIRVKACGISLDYCIKLGQAEEAVRSGDGIEAHILSIDHFYSDCGKITVEGDTEKRVMNGNTFMIPDLPSARYRVYLSDGTFAALYDIDRQEARLCRMFL